MLSVVRRTRYSPPPTVIPSLREDGARVGEGILKCERGTVLSGRLGTVVDGKEMVFEAGEEFAFPAGPMHTW